MSDEGPHADMDTAAQPGGQGVLPIEVPAEVSTLVAERDAARGARDYARADALREEIGAAGFDVIDDPSGSTIRARR